MTAASVATDHEQWRAELSSAFNGLVPDARDTRGTIAQARLGPVATFQVTGASQVLRRTARQLKTRPSDMLKVCIQRAGTAMVQQDDRDIAVDAGFMAIYDIDRPYALRLDGERWCSDVIAFPRTALAIPDRLLRALMSRVVPATSGPGAVLSEFVCTTVRQRSGIAADGVAEHLGRAALDLVAAALSGPDTLPDEPDPVRWQITSYIRANLADPTLCHDTVAAAHHMSGRTLHRLFSTEAQSVSQLIRSMRLDAIHRELTANTNRSINQVAARWGLHDMPHFVRIFRATYGMRPSDLRRN
ncbi:MAG TPA: helix-turn-helix transcriptional regulator [Pseudonocardiaceae bacterium]